MNPEALEQAVNMARASFLFVATADADGMPHLAAARDLALARSDEVSVIEWFCPRTLANLQANPRIAIVVWNATENSGFQLVGRVQNMVELGIIDGYAPAAEPIPLPQVERMLLVKVESVLRFLQAPHSDIEE